MTYSEDQLLPLSALQHLLFCERQCAMIHIEQAWDENRLTVQGRLLHERVHDGDDETRHDVRIVRGLRLRSLRLGLVGVADVVEFHSPSSPNLKSQRIPFPVEYKRGKAKANRCDEVQLCAQAMCLEEMLGTEVPAGAIFYGAPRRRMQVPLDGHLRLVVGQAAERLHRLIAAGLTPPAVYEKKCESCSLLHLCLPETAGRGKSATRYLSQII